MKKCRLVQVVIDALFISALDWSVCGSQPGRVTALGIFPRTHGLCGRVGQRVGLETLKNRNVFGRWTGNTVTTLTDAVFVSSYKMFCTLKCNYSILWRYDLLHNFYHVDLRQTVGDSDSINLLAPEFFLILAHPVYKMWFIQEPNTLELWNKLHFVDKKSESIYHV